MRAEREIQFLIWAMQRTEEDGARREPETMTTLECAVRFRRALEWAMGENNDVCGLVENFKMAAALAGKETPPQ